MKQFAWITFIMLAAQLSAFAQPSLELAWSYYEANEYQRCLANLEDHAGADVLFLRGNCHQKMGNLTLALSAYDAAASSGCEHTNLHLNRGICRLSMEMLEAAEQDLKRHLRIDPQSERALYYMAQLEYMRFSTSTSMDYLERCLNVNPDNTDALYLQAGNLADQEKWMLASSTFQEVLSIDPTHYMAQQATAQVFLQWNKPQDAIGILNSLTQHPDADLGLIYFFLAEAHYQLHQQEEACEMWEKSADLGDKDAAKNQVNICVKGKSRLRRKKMTYAEF